MAIDDSDPGLRAAAESARAQSRTRVRLAPPPPPDEQSSPFARPMGPQIQTERRQAMDDAVRGFEPPERPQPKAAPAPKPTIPKPAPDKRRAKASELIDKLLKKWSSEAGTNPALANRNLARMLMSNGSGLIDCAYPLDTLGGLINIAQKLQTISADEEGGDAESEKLRRWMSRQDDPADKPEAPEEETPETE